MNEKICLVTGANSGIGKVTAKALAAGEGRSRAR
jgi:NAD(P)-dependent dehydrogenase (short-subunit alcohol dehydrogenase family)